MFNMSQNKFLDDLECEICTERYDDKKRRPKSLPCGHTFCSECMAKDIIKGKGTCPTCRNPHNAKSVADLPMNVIVERLVRNLPKVLSVRAMSHDPEDEDEEEDDYSGGPCSTHKKSVVYFYCETHSLLVCRECTVIDHPANKCKIISLKEKIERKKNNNIHKASSTVTTINETLSALGEYVKGKDNIISDQEHTIQKWKKVIDDASKAIGDATNTISKEKIEREKAKNEISQGTVKMHHVEAAKKSLQNAKTTKTIEMRSSDIETVSTTVTKWVQDVSTKFDLLFKFQIASLAPANILKGLSDGKVMCIETTINGTKATAKLAAKDDKIHMHPFKYESSQTGAITFQYDHVVSCLPRQLPTLLFLDLTYKNVYQGRVYIRLQPELSAFIKNIPALVTGENGNSILGNKCKNSFRNQHLVIDIEKTVSDISSHKKESVITQYGDVVCYILGNSICDMDIYIGNEQTTYSSKCAKIGHVESSMDVVKTCKGLSYQRSMNISDCGLVLEI